ncbi:mechanosensitive ion channel family protein [Pseudoalteromonas fenneropenaei]|uniref:Small-conductance mechanosensitive channel n=1 Tax=Pseudoalteromonas fenneropenaei TaxID=1737459 RepID=A0ABV7CKX3_9GAMM
MTPAPTSASWQHALAASYEQLLSQIATFLPHLFGAIMLLLLGWGIAWALSKLTLTLLALTNRVMASVSQRLQSEKIIQLNPKHARFISRAIFWVIMMFFIAAATSSLGLDFFSGWIASLLSYLPKLVAGVLIMVGGYLIGNLVAAMARAGAQSMGFARVEAVARTAKLAVLFTAMVIGVEQLGINIQFVTNIVIVVTGVLCFGVALAFGLGSRELIANTVAARQVLRHCRINDQIEIAGLSGRLTEVTATMVVIESDKGRTLLPASWFFTQPSFTRVSNSTDTNS